MKKYIFVLALFVFAPSMVFAANEGNGNGNQSGVTTASANSGNSSSTTTSTQQQNTNRSQTETNNPGVGDMTRTRDEIQLEEQYKDGALYTPTNQMSQTRLRATDKALKAIIQLMSSVSNQGVANRISLSAYTQLQNQDSINKSMDTAAKRSGVAKFFVGPNYKELKKAKQLMEQNQQQIQIMEQLKTQLNNAGDETKLQEQIQILQQQQTELSNQLASLTKGFSLFGWLNRWRNQY